MRQSIIIIAAIVISLGAGVFVGMKIKKTSVPVAGGDSYKSGWEAAMQTVKESGIIPQPPDGMGMKNITGIVQTISGNTLTLKITMPGLIDAPELITRTVTIDANTKIFQLVQKDPAQVQKEMAVFEEKFKEQQANKTSEVLPMVDIQDKKEVTVSSIKAGQIVMIRVEDDIKNKQQFTASEIQIQPVMQDLLQPISETPAAVK
jgi:hypothetical protein